MRKLKSQKSQVAQNLSFRKTHSQNYYSQFALTNYDIIIYTIFLD